MTELVPTGPQAFSFEGHDVRVLIIGGEPWWVANDVCAVLGLADVRRAVERLEAEDRRQTPVLDARNVHQMTWVINEPGLYDLIIRSDKPAAKPFRRWVTGEVLPSIRKTGSYGRELSRLELAQMIVEAEKERLAIESQLHEATERVDELSGYVAQIGPEAGSWRALAATGDDWLVEDVARILNRDAAIEIGGGRLWAKLYEWNVMTRYRERPQPRQEYIDRGYFRVRIVTYPDPKGGLTPKSAPQVRVTYKGVTWLHHKLGGTDAVDDLMTDGPDTEAA